MSRLLLIVKWLLAGLIVISFAFLLSLTHSSIPISELSDSIPPNPGLLSRLLLTALSLKFDSNASLYSSSVCAIGTLSAYITAFAAIYAMLDIFIQRNFPALSIKRADNNKDLKIMAKYYMDATHVIVFAGSFDWMTACDELKNAVNNLAKHGKITMVSSRDEATVRSAMGIDLFDGVKHRMKFDFGCDIRCSYIKWDSGETILYRHKDGIDDKPYMLIIHSSGIMKKIVNMTAWFMNDAAKI